MTIEDFINCVKRIKDPEAMLKFYENEVASMREQHPEVVDPEAVVRSNIGWVFGEGMAPPLRRLWRDACGAEHPTLGPEFTDREFTGEECFQAGLRLSEKYKHQRVGTGLP